MRLQVIEGEAAARKAPPLRETTDTASWVDWKWQQRNAVRSIAALLQVFPGVPEPTVEAIERNLAGRRIQITPYALSLIQRTPDGRAPLPEDPIWRQLVPVWTSETTGAYKYDGETENWELPHEMVTPIAQHKYSNRVIIRLSNVCHSYCQFCYEALRTLEKDTSKLAFDAEHWRATLEFLRRNRAIEEVILSGGEPLQHSDEQLDRVLGELRALGREIAIRIHTRALTFNPYRITPALLESFRKHKVSALGVHVAHPNEISSAFVETCEALHTAVPIMFANIPLLARVNDTEEVMHPLCMRLYSVGVIPHYLYHFMPFSPGSEEYRTSVQAGIDLVRALKRHVTNLAVPEFVLPHASGKHSPPLLLAGERPMEWVTNEHGHRVVRYTNWQGAVIEYPDVD